MRAVRNFDKQSKFNHRGFAPKGIRSAERGFDGVGNNNLVTTFQIKPSILYLRRGIGFRILSDNYLGSALQTTDIFRNSSGQKPTERGRGERVLDGV